MNVNTADDSAVTPNGQVAEPHETATPPTSPLPTRGAAIDRRAVAGFLAVAFALAWALFLLPLASSPPGAPTRQTATLLAWAAAMWAPGLAAILATRFIAGRSLRELGLGRLGPRRMYLWAWLLPIGAALVTGLLTLALGAGRLDLEFTVIRDAMAQAPGGEAVAPALVVALQVVFALTLAPLINTPFALGEELGWRGFLLPQLRPLGQWRAILVTGVIWGFWHAPAILQGHNYPSQPVLGVFLMVGFCLLAGTFLSWLYLVTRSPWAPALGHGALNASAGLPLLFVRDVDLVIGGTVASLIGWLPLAAIVAWLVLTHRLPVPEEPAGTEALADPASPAPAAA